MTSYRFGFLDKQVTYRFAGGEIAPVPEFDAAEKWVAIYGHKDGFIYPPTGRFHDEEGKPLPNTERPAHLFHVPVTHELRLDHNPPSTDQHRAHASFIINLVAYLHGTCVQFEDWWFDARVPLGKHHNIHFYQATAEHFLTHAYQCWQAWPPDSQMRFTNLLFMLNRAPSYQWDWEHFVIEYMVLDACYRIAEDHFAVVNGSHSKRIERMCNLFGVQQNAVLTIDIVRLRNELFHEALWDNTQPGTASSPSSFIAPCHLRRLNQRLVLALLGYHNEYMRSAWWFTGTWLFGVP